MQVTYLSLAVWDIAQIQSNIATNNPDTAKQIGKRLTQIINQLSILPNLGKPGRVFGTRELITPKIGKTAYIIVYRIKSERVEILPVLSGMRNIEQILDENFPEEEN